MARRRKARRSRARKSRKMRRVKGDLCRKANGQFTKCRL